MWLSWMLTVFLTACAVWLMPAARGAVLEAFNSISLLKAFWPVAAGILISGIAWLMAVRNRWSMNFAIGQGDILLIISYVLRLVFEFSLVQAQRVRHSVTELLKYPERLKPTKHMIREIPPRLENRLTDWRTAGLLFVLLTGCLFAWALV